MSALGKAGREGLFCCEESGGGESGRGWHFGKGRKGGRVVSSRIFICWDRQRYI